MLAGGVHFGAIRRSELWGDLNTSSSRRWACRLVRGRRRAVGALTPSTERPGRAAVARAAVPAVAGVIVAVAMDRNRLSTSIQLLPGVFGDPFGRGWDLLGRAGARLDPAPLGTTGLLVAQLAVLLAGYLAGAVLLVRRVPRRARARIAAVLSVLAGVSVIAVASH